MANNYGGYSGNIPADARRMAMRKLTCRQIAQWAVNCVDMRDPDVIMTPFEYDENPWDGWGVVDTKHGSAIFPLDGDLCTDENLTQIRPVDNTGWQPIAAQFQAANKPDPANAIDQTRGVVWARSGRNC